MWSSSSPLTFHLGFDVYVWLCSRMGRKVFWWKEKIKLLWCHCSPYPHPIHVFSCVGGSLEAQIKHNKELDLWNRFLDGGLKLGAPEIECPTNFPFSPPHLPYSYPFTPKFQCVVPGLLTSNTGLNPHGITEISWGKGSVSRRGESMLGCDLWC